MTIEHSQAQGWTESWPARVSAILAIGQGVAIFGLIWFLISRIEFPSEVPSGPISLYIVDVVFFSIALGLPALLAALSGIGMLFYWRAAWLLAVLAEALLLAASLYIYFYLPDSQFERSIYIYAIMAVSGLMAFYLNTSDVRLAFAPNGARAG
jgi:hypothetical protein